MKHILKKSACVMLVLAVLLGFAHVTQYAYASVRADGNTGSGFAATWINAVLSLEQQNDDTINMRYDDHMDMTGKTVEIIDAGHSWVGSYRAGVYSYTTTVPYYQSFKDLRFNGPRVAQYWMGNNPELADIWNVCTIQEGWATLPDGTDGVEAYFRSAYENGIVDYATQVQQSASWYCPTTPSAVHDNIHYNQIGYNEIGRESARNALIMLHEIQPPDVDATVTFMTWDGFTPAANVVVSPNGYSDTLVVPMVYPVWKSKEVSYTVSDGLRSD